MGFAVGVIVGGLGVGRMATHAQAAQAGLTAAEEGTLRSVLADGRQTRQTAVAYFVEMEGADRTAASARGSNEVASDHRDEIDLVVADSIREHLVEALGAARADQLESRVGSLAALVEEPSSRRP